LAKQPVAVVKEPPLKVGTWYIDRTKGHMARPLSARFQLVRVSAETVDVLDEWKNRRTVNRALWERDMEPA